MREIEGRARADTMQRAMAESKPPSNAASSIPKGEQRSRVSNPDIGKDPPRRTLLASTRVKAADGSTSLLQAFGIAPNLGTKAAITRPFEEIPWVKACVKAKGQAVASCMAELWIGDPRTEKGAKKLPDNDPLVRLFRRPMPRTTTSQWVEMDCHHRMLDGEGHWFMLGPDDKPLRIGLGAKIPVPKWLYSVRGAAVGLVRDSRGWPARWTATLQGGGVLDAPAESVIQFRDYHIDDPQRGLGDVEALKNDLDIEWQALRYQRNILKNSGDPGGFITSETPLAPEEEESLENEAAQTFDVQNAGQWKMLSGKNIKYEPNKITPRDMDFAKLRPWTRDMICAVCGVPPPILGILDHAALANFEESVRLFWLGGNGVIPYLNTVEDVVNELFFRDLDHPHAERLFLRFNTERIKALLTDRQLQLNIAAQIREKLGLTNEESLALVGITPDQPLKHGDVVLVPSGWTTMDRVLEDAENPPEPETDPNGDGGDEPPPKDTGTSAGDDSEEPAKAVAPVAREAEPEVDPAVAAAQVRRQYWTEKESRILAAGEVRLRSIYRGFRKDYERSQYKLLRDFAAEGDSALRAAPPITRAGADGPADDGFSKPAVSAAEVERLLLDRADQAKKMNARFTPAILDIWANALQDVSEELGGDFLLTPSDEAVLAALRAQVVRLTEGHTSVLADRVRETLIEGLSKATSTGTLQERVAEVLDDLQDQLKETFSDRQTRANTIARTETAKAANGARFMGMKRAGVTQHTWVTSKDAAVRGTPGGPYEDAQYSHFELDGKTVVVGSEFDPSGHPGLKYPGDDDARAGDTIQCRCLAMPVRIQDEGDTE